MKFTWVIGFHIERKAVFLKQDVGMPRWLLVPIPSSRELNTALPGFVLSLGGC